MKGFIRHLRVNNNFNKSDLEDAKDNLCLITDDGNIKYNVQRINDYTLEYRFYATKSQIDISGYAFKMSSKDKNVEISILYNGGYLVEYFERKSLFDDKLFIEVLIDIPTRCRKEFRITLTNTKKKKINVKSVYRRTSIEYNRYMVIDNKK